jgi:hypothetical protein
MGLFFECTEVDLKSVFGDIGYERDYKGRLGDVAICRMSGDYVIFWKTGLISSYSNRYRNQFCTSLIEHIPEPSV